MCGLSCHALSVRPWIPGSRCGTVHAEDCLQESCSGLAYIAKNKYAIWYQEQYVYLYCYDIRNDMSHAGYQNNYVLIMWQNNILILIHSLQSHFVCKKRYWLIWQTKSFFLIWVSLRYKYISQSDTWLVHVNVVTGEYQLFNIINIIIFTL